MEFHPREFFKKDDQNRLKLRWEAFCYLNRRGLDLLYHSKEPLEVFLDEFDIVGHDGFIWLLSVIKYRSQQGVGPTYVRLPSRHDQLVTINNLHFPQQAQLHGAIITNAYRLPPDSFELGSSLNPFSPRFLQYVCPQTWDKICTALFHYFDKEIPGLLKIPKEQVNHTTEGKYFHRLIAELIFNAVEHGGLAPREGIGFACYHPWPTKYPMLRFCCNDLGRGFLWTIREKARKASVELQTEREAILYALLYRFFCPQDGVLGYYKAMPFIYQLCGRLMIRSGDVLAVLDLTRECLVDKVFLEGYKKPSGKWLKDIVYVRKLPTVPGTHVLLDLSVGGRRWWPQ